MSKETEATALATRFVAVKNRAAFAREFGIAGGGAMIYQHIKGIKPISIDAALAYATGFKCSLEEISPSAAEKLRPLLSSSSDENIRAVVTLMESLTAEQRLYLRGRIEGWAENLPKPGVESAAFYGQPSPAESHRVKSLADKLAAKE